ncbi:hypothetical protein [Clostridium beijerinckii]|uniref:K+-sensing histidine kinase KdpD n=2 Tax=Clostridium beijerinckii TaxID=1520 RepID=A0A9Q5GIA5_CLOBE|nr:hypothetical protein [Clostridium beijerinckii]MBA2886149.1 K+-sensing histidine kinase KdpD [Clostridium beijerinckii]MBA2900993.1 K+-sensing histidine kinase KdpD [Clostridium beijerinckii]MBA2910708.1 K+-sensing histidine kinase KdpD [Clostridium beijerinckii]MBA9014281.1 K+-sensing histidine kinase KdpD [Clostridium beijerinckii]NRT03295.1 K+-sensing histidine kinase KdpD [Clostridium beijerinckii]
MELTIRHMLFSNGSIILLFDKFYAADKSRNSRSTGLGLSIVKLLAEKTNAKSVAEINSDILTLRFLFL